MAQALIQVHDLKKYYNGGDVKALDGVTGAAVSHEAGTAVVTLSRDVADADLKAAVEAKDYTVTGIDA